MRNRLFGLVAIAFATAAMIGAAVSQSVNRMEQGGASWVVGGTLNIESGGQLQIAGVDKTSAVAAGVTTPVAGLAAGYKVARGEAVVTTPGSIAVATGLATIVSCTATIKKSTTPGSGSSVVTYGTSSGTATFYHWQPTAAGDTALAAGTDDPTIGWICVGT